MPLAMLPLHQRQYGMDLIEPRRWLLDGGTRREPVLDPNFDPPRLVRWVGWRSCMHCDHWMWSDDVRRVRMHQECTQPNHDLF